MAEGGGYLLELAEGSDENPEYYVVMFRPEMVDCQDPLLDEAGSRAFSALVSLMIRGPCVAPRRCE